MRYSDPSPLSATLADRLTFAHPFQTWHVMATMKDGSVRHASVYGATLSEAIARARRLIPHARSIEVI